ncbi:MAG: TIGR01777 family oxidoreductase [Chloroflexi bacterium]|nr:TIGR01777 family oxidoreductase [Chloroflexota bacterium]
MRVALTGGSGLIGGAVTAALLADGHEVIHLVRPPRRAAEGQVAWDPAGGTIDAGGLEGLDAVVHLAGEPTTAWRWTAAKKRRIYASRVDGTRLLAETLAVLQSRPRVFVSYSAVGYYGDRGDEVLREDSPPGSGFLAKVATDWEAAAHPATGREIRVVHLRGAPVVAGHSAFLTRQAPAFKLGLGGPLGSGRQWWPWVALEDVVGVVRHVLARDDIRGPVNVVAPELCTNFEFARTLGRVLGRPALLPVPSPLLRAAMGEIAGEMLLASQRVEPARLVESGYHFHFPMLEPALRHALSRPFA